MTNTNTARTARTALATVNGRPVYSVAYAHRLWANFLDMQDRFAECRPVARSADRARLVALATALVLTVRDAWENRANDKFAARVAMNRLVRLEAELGAFYAELPLSEDFSERTSGYVYDPDSDRLDGDAFDLEASKAEAEAEAIKLRFELHRIRKSTTNRVSLSKAGLIGRFSWGEAWAETKATMRELGAEIRENEGWAKAVERELTLRDREHEAEFNRGTVECEWGYDLPSDDDQRCWSARDLEEMSRG